MVSSVMGFLNGLLPANCVTLSLILFCEWTIPYAGAEQTAQQFATAGFLDKQAFPPSSLQSRLGNQEVETWEKSSLLGCPSAEVLTRVPLSQIIRAPSKTRVLSHPL